jgi:hypothetical protein
MKRIVVLALLFCLASVARAADEKEKAAKSRIASVGLFKNGLALVQRTIPLEGPGVYCVEDVPEPINGTYWVESDAKVSTRLTRRIVEVPAEDSNLGNLQEELAGRQVEIHFSDQGIPVVTGVILGIDPLHGEDAAGRAAMSRSDVYSSVGSGSTPGGRMLVLRNESGLCYVDPAKIAFLQAKGSGQTIKQRKGVMIFTVGEMKEKSATISINYLARGMSWAPSYRVDISDPKNLVLRQSAVLKNELAAIADAQVRLISGFPSVQFANVTSPLALSTNWNNFFQQLNQRVGVRSGMGSILSNSISQVASNGYVDNNRVGFDTGMDLSANPTGEGVDIHYQDIGRITLAEGDSMSLDTASGKAAYQRIVEWKVPDTRRADGIKISDSELNSDPDRYQDSVWDAIQFRNPLSFPMTTAPAMIVDQGRFNGQQISFWVNPGEETTMQVTKALSIRTRNVEEEEEGSRETAFIGGAQYRKTTVKGELTVNNHRKEEISLVIRRRFSGEMVSADKSPKQRLLEEGVASVNKRNELLWNLPLKSGEEVKIVYRYTVLVRTNTAG